jgi:hypothetical protein
VTVVSVMAHCLTFFFRILKALLIDLIEKSIETKRTKIMLRRYVIYCNVWFTLRAYSKIYPPWRYCRTDIFCSRAFFVDKKKMLILELIHIRVNRWTRTAEIENAESNLLPWGVKFQTFSPAENTYDMI